MYEKAIAEGKAIVEAVEKPEDVTAAGEAIKKITHALTSEKEIRDMLKKHLTEKKIVYDKAKKVYCYADESKA